MSKNEKNILETLLTLKWQSPYGSHTEKYYAKINVWRDADLFPRPIAQALKDAELNQTLIFDFSPGELFPFSEDLILEVSPKSQFRPPEKFSHIKPKLGRFYPLFFFRFLPGALGSSIYPGRIIGANGTKETYLLDANHPLARYPLRLEIEILNVLPKERETGGRCRDWIEEAFRVGPGMESRYDHLPTDFGFDEPENFAREDETPDTYFYREPRFIGHIDRLCHKHLVEFYSTLLPKSGKILDLMSSWESHLPDFPFDVIGLGINEEELKANPRLKDYVVKDLNQDPSLPFERESFDAVVCDLSIEYVVKPLELLSEIRRVLKPGGIATFSFSNRYFPPKVIKLWVDLHEFERMGYVLELLIRTDFKDLGTFSLRGYPRPSDDRWIACTMLSDPLYVVWGRK